MALLFTSVAVCFVVLFAQFFRMLTFVIDNAGGVWVFFKLMALLVPTFLPLVLPISLGIAVLFVYHKLAMDSELVVLGAAGLSPKQLARPALGVALASLLLGLLLSLWLTPAASRALVTLQYAVRDDFSAFILRPGAFNDIGKGLTVFARRRSSEGGLEDILVHDVRQARKPVTIMAEKGRLSFESRAPKIIVFEGRRQEMNLETGHLQELVFDSYVLDLQMIKSARKDRMPDAREMSLPRLLREQASPQHTARFITRLRTEIHQRLAGPLLSLTFTYVAVTVILVGSFNRRGMTRRVLMAALAMVVVQAVMFGLVSLAGKTPWAALLLYMAVLSPLLPCFYWLSNKQRGRA